MLWDIRKSQGTLTPEPVIELDGHMGPVPLVHMDPYKIVTGGPEDDHISVWEVETGTQTNTWVCSSDEEPNSNSGCSAMAVNGCRFVTASCGKGMGLYGLGTSLMLHALFLLFHMKINHLQNFGILNPTVIPKTLMTD